MKQIYEGVFAEGKNLFTINMIPGKKVYDEKLIRENNTELRSWDPERSKLAASLLNGQKIMPIKKGSKVLYLGASTGTTPSHVSDIVGRTGIIYAVEFAERVFRNLMVLCEARKNIAPIFADARKTEDYDFIEQCDVVYVDIADPQETEITIRNANVFLKESGHVFIAVKSQSIDVTKQPQQVYKEEADKLRKHGFEIMEIIDLEPHEEKHAMIVARK